MTHRTLIIVGILLVVGTTAPAAAAERPNVLFIAVDDLNDWIGCMKGHPQAQTPNMDRLAARGVLFTNAHCAAPACNPSRAAVFSGRMPGSTGVWSNRSRRLLQLCPEITTLPKALAQVGYRTLGTGKLLHSGVSNEAGFSDYFAVEQRWSPFPKSAVRYTADEQPSKGTDNPRHVLNDSQGRKVVLPLNGMPSDRKPHTPDGESFDWGPFDSPAADWGDTQITDWAIDQIEAGSDAPLFLGVGYYRPHIPLWAPKRYFDRFADSPGQLPPVKDDDLEDLGNVARWWALEPITAGSHATVLQYQQWQAAVEAYLACVTYVDAEIGRLLDTLDASNFADNTVIVLWSDHGWHLGEKQHWGKWTCWERSTRVPLIIVPPKRSAQRFAAAGTRCDQPVSLIDLYPTLTELCATDPPDNLDGQSLVPLLREPEKATDRCILTSVDPGNASLRTDRWRYLRYEDGSEELYDLHDDPHEWDNLALNRRHDQTLQAMRAEYDSFPAHVLGNDEAARRRAEQFQQLADAPWKQVFHDPCTDQWQDRWTLDGLKATVTNTEQGMDFQAGPHRKEDSSHAVMWTKDSFAGDIRLDYEYTKLDDAVEAVTILYLQATGSGAEGYDADIAKWRDKREVASMRTYYNHMNLLHISYAAFGVGNTDPQKDYIRARRYRPDRRRGLHGTDLLPDYFETGLFKQGVPHDITIIKTGEHLFMHIRNDDTQKLCHWRTDVARPVLQGRIGLRHMWTRAARYCDFRISQLAPKTRQ